MLYHLSPITRRSASSAAAVAVAVAGRRLWHHGQSRCFVEARIKWIRDRGLDHAVEKEKNLLPFHSLKDLLLLSSPSTSSSPLSFIADRRASLALPFRAIRFLRLFPAAFIEELPAPAPVPAPGAAGGALTLAPPHPSIRATTELSYIHDEELQAFSSCRAETADRLLRLLMLCPARRIPLSVIDQLRWDLGLPRGFLLSLLPDYPDYFRLSPAADGSPALDLELVCYNKALTVSAMELRATATGYKKGQPLAFPLHFPRGFQPEKKVRKWIDEWQKLPYISPYEDASHLPPKSDFTEKWTVAMLHEVLSLFVSKKTVKDNLLLLAPHLGLPPAFKKVFPHHPGIFYLSNKLSTHTVVLKEAYHRDLLLVKHPLMGFRYRYIHLMHKGKEANSGKNKHQKLNGGGLVTGIGNNDSHGYEEESEEFSEEYTMSEDDESDDELEKITTRKSGSLVNGEVPQLTSGRIPLLRRALQGTSLESNSHSHHARPNFRRKYVLRKDDDVGICFTGVDRRSSIRRQIVQH